MGVTVINRAGAGPSLAEEVVDEEDEMVINATPSSDSKDATALREAMAEHQLFAGLSDDAIDRLTPACRVKHFTDEEVGCHSGDAHHEAYVVLAGTLALSESVKDMRHVVDLAREGAAVNLGALLGLMQPHTSAVAMGSATVLAIDRKMLLAVMDDDLTIGYLMLMSLSRLLVAQANRALTNLLG
jgi:CRP-like cAMP-binding protein